MILHMLAHHIKISFYEILQLHINSATLSLHLRSRVVPSTLFLLIKTSKYNVICIITITRVLAGISDSLSTAIFYFYNQDPVLLSIYKDGIRHMKRILVQDGNREGSCIHLLWGNPESTAI